MDLSRSLTGKRQEARGKYVTATAVVSVKWCSWITHFGWSSDVFA